MGGKTVVRPVTAREEYPGGRAFAVVAGDLLSEPVDAIDRIERSERQDRWLCPTAVRSPWSGRTPQPPS